MDGALSPTAAETRTVRCPALLIAAPASGQGKTTVTAALARLHSRAGRRVRVFKCGPDFLDPFWHELASEAPVHQLDLWMTGEADIRQRLHQAATEADLVLVEGVMGLYDGDPSAADLARLLGLPVLAVVDASAMAQTFGALAHGLRTYQQASHGPLRWAGVLANRVASERHATMLREATPAPDWLGALMRNPALTLPERHLGLVAAQELPDALARLDAAADALAATPLGQMGLADMLAAWGVEFIKPFYAPSLSFIQKFAIDSMFAQGLLAGRTVAVARDAAFCFIYAANLDTLRQLGAAVVCFSPLADAELPACDAVWLPGGYPELHAATLAANHRLRDALRTHAAAGKPVWAECGGMMLLMDQLVDKAGVAHPMWGLLPGTVTMQTRLAALGPQQLDWYAQGGAVVGDGLGGAGGVDGDLSLASQGLSDSHGAGHTSALRGHTYHWSVVHTPLLPVARTHRPGAAAQPVATGTEGEAVYQQGSVRASYFHAWFASAPGVVAQLFCQPPEIQPAAEPAPTVEAE